MLYLMKLISTPVEWHKVLKQTLKQRCLIYLKIFSSKPVWFFKLKPDLLGYNFTGKRIIKITARFNLHYLFNKTFYLLFEDLLEIGDS